jgi:hypothetical protein
MALFGAFRFLTIYCTLSVLSTLAVATETFSAEEKLEAIKQALVDLAMESEVTLGSAAYIDSQGVLHESALMSSNSQVRGVRVLSYLEEAGIPVARVEASMLSDRSCPGARPELRREALLRTGHRGVNKRLGDHYLSEVATLSREVVMSALSGSTEWTARPEVRYSSNYDNLVSGGSSDRIPYRFDVTISEHNPAALDRHQLFDVIDYGASMGKAALDFAFGYSEWTGMAGAFWGILPVLDDDSEVGSSLFPLRKAAGYYSLSMLPEYARSVAPWPSSNLDYELVIVDRKREMPLWRKTLMLSYPRLPKGFTKSDMPPEFRHQIMLATEQMMAEATASMTCTAQYYHLSNADGERGVATINAGSLAGVQLGDQFLLSSDPNILNAAVDSSALSSLALARVESVNRHTAVLKHIAGPRWSSAQANDNFVALYF